MNEVFIHRMSPISGSFPGRARELRG